MKFTRAYWIEMEDIGVNWSKMYYNGRKWNGWIILSIMELTEV